MKPFIMIFVLAFSSLAGATSTCHLETGYGTFVGYGKSESVAFEKAAERCFDSMKIVKSKKSKSTDISEDQQLDFIDYCVNLSCG